jgi:hypothetical protein
MRLPPDSQSGGPLDRYPPWIFAAALSHRAALGRGIAAVIATVGWVATSFLWLLVVLVVYAALTVLAGHLDSTWSQGPAGPTPPETYS